MSIHSISEDWCWGSTNNFIYDNCALCCLEFLKGTHWGYIYGLLVSKEHRRMGIATRLIRCAEQYIIECGYAESRLDVEKGRHWQKQWYERLGYEVYYEDEDLYYMKKTLS